MARTIDIDDLYMRLQAHFSYGLVTVVGSGLSIACGLPSMATLANELISTISPNNDAMAAWGRFKDSITAGNGLEKALEYVTEEETLRAVQATIADSVHSAEQPAIQELLMRTRTHPITTLLPYLQYPNNRISIVTTNYDRLVEVAVELAGYILDTSFTGQFYGFHDCAKSKNKTFTGMQSHKNQSYPQFGPCVEILKPHGSLDWFLINGEVRFCSLVNGGDRRLIAPGTNKYRTGYNKPFDNHISRSNIAIDGAKGFLIVGYGFNDDHLQIHLKDEILRGKPTLILSRKLTKSALDIAYNHEKVIALEESEDRMNTRVFFRGNEDVIPRMELWDLGRFIEQVLI